MLTTDDAAQRLGVSTHEVRRLINAGNLRAAMKGRTWLVDERSVAERVGTRPTRGRALAARTAWAALFEASGEKASWLDAHTRSRLRKWLREQQIDAIARACRRRGDRYAFRVLPAYQDRLLTADRVTRGGLSAAADAGADLVVMSGVATASEMYCDEQTLAALVKKFGLTDTGKPNVVVRVPRWNDGRLLAGNALPAAVIAVDLMEAGDFRTRRAGRDLLATLRDANLELNE